MNAEQRVAEMVRTSASPTDFIRKALTEILDKLDKVDPVEVLSKLDCEDLVLKVRKFHVKFGLEYIGPPRVLPMDIRKLKFRHLDEELDEYKKAVRANDLEKAFDALIDLVYVAIGTAHSHGFDFNEGFRRVHDANMQKVRATDPSDSKRGSTFDVVKPKGWKAPCLKDLTDRK